jgi:hypothetical protein
MMRQELKLNQGPFGKQKESVEARAHQSRLVEVINLVQKGEKHFRFDVGFELKLCTFPMPALNSSIELDLVGKQVLSEF